MHSVADRKLAVLKVTLSHGATQKRCESQLQQQQVAHLLHRAVKHTRGDDHLPLGYSTFKQPSRVRDQLKYFKSNNKYVGVST